MLANYILCKARNNVPIRARSARISISPYRNIICTEPSINSLEHNKVVDLQPLVTHRYKLEEANKALEASADRNSGSIKIHIEDHEP